jgi:uncharacterized membrane protein
MFAQKPQGLPTMNNNRMAAAIFFSAVIVATLLADDSQLVAQSWGRAVFMLITGMVVLVFGLYHQQMIPVTICCGNVQQAQEALANVK